jgi:hypothetical protein
MVQGAIEIVERRFRFNSRCVTMTSLNVWTLGKYSMFFLAASRGSMVSSSQALVFAHESINTS